MVNQDNGFHTTTHDWEFFELDASKGGTRIQKLLAALGLHQNPCPLCADLLNRQALFAAPAARRSVVVALRRAWALSWWNDPSALSAPCGGTRCRSAHHGMHGNRKPARRCHAGMAVIAPFVFRI